jgi:hypothetical protein
MTRVHAIHGLPKRLFLPAFQLRGSSSAASRASGRRSVPGAPQTRPSQFGAASGAADAARADPQLDRKVGRVERRVPQQRAEQPAQSLRAQRAGAACGGQHRRATGEPDDDAFAVAAIRTRCPYWFTASSSPRRSIARRASAFTAV